MLRFHFATRRQEFRAADARIKSLHVSDSQPRRSVPAGWSKEELIACALYDMSKTSTTSGTIISIIATLRAVCLEVFPAQAYLTYWVSLFRATLAQSESAAAIGLDPRGATAGLFCLRKELPQAFFSKPSQNNFLQLFNQIF